ncbi:hypothetical protein E7Y32_12355 [Arthrobacter sp. UKPF54-2]|uniref:hypothetical protein n=1 Tax=Arthrobacter sp. UKPF54-2 TaxID=2600159 RepID=UPI0011B1A4C6|nr:hypothetical protein [Arthrobacter sp. UKPF54-2]QDY90910.1 hypothetical protein E7Y32_12355 [Arthrobacter sp. UKPF54-2]
MSQEQPPIRSRRELRQARDERQDVNPGAGTAGAVPAAPERTGIAGADTAGSEAVRGAANPAFSERPEEPTEAETTGRRRIPGPVDSVRSTSAAQRSSQIRARDRAALRTIKELAEKEGQLSPGGPPTRRQLRLQQLAEETAPATSANPIVPMPSPRTRSHPVVAPAAAAPELQSAPAAPDGGAPGPDGGAPGPVGKPPEGMSVEQALAARELLAAQARNQVAKMEHIAATDPDAVNPEVLAEQIALAERAAVLNRRAAAKQKLAEQNSQTPQRNDPPRNDPSTASNLAMVTPLEFVEVPGIERPVMKRPATSHVPVATNPSPKVQPKSSRRPGLSRLRDAAPVKGRAGVLARAEAAAQAGTRPAVPAAQPVPEAPVTEEDFAARPPVAANAAYGLDPLDAATAGLGRAQRLRALQLGVLALGVLALIAGIILIITGMAH